MMMMMVMMMMMTRPVPVLCASIIIPAVLTSNCSSKDGDWRQFAAESAALEA